MNRLLRFTLGSILLALAPGLSQAQYGGNEDATIGMFLVKATEYANEACNYPAADCEDGNLNVNGMLSTPYYAYVCVFNADSERGIAGAEFAVEYDGGSSSGVDIFSFTSCTDLFIKEPAWPTTGSGGTFTWDRTVNCQEDEPGGFGSGVTAVVGFFYLSAYSNDTLGIVPRSINNVVAIATCDIATDEIPQKQWGSLGFSEDGSVEGNPGCKRVIIQNTSWGSLKDSFNN